MDALIRVSFFGRTETANEPSNINTLSREFKPSSPNWTIASIIAAMTDEVLYRGGFGKDGTVELTLKWRTRRPASGIAVYESNYSNLLWAVLTIARQSEDLVTDRGKRIMASRGLREALLLCLQHSGRPSTDLIYGEAVSGLELNDVDRWVPVITTSAVSSLRPRHELPHLVQNLQAPVTTAYDLASTYLKLFVKNFVAPFTFHDRLRLHNPDNDIPRLISNIIAVYHSALHFYSTADREGGWDERVTAGFKILEFDSRTRDFLAHWIVEVMAVGQRSGGALGAGTRVETLTSKRALSARLMVAAFDSHFTSTTWTLDSRDEHDLIIDPFVWLPIANLREHGLDSNHQDLNPGLPVEGALSLSSLTRIT